MISSLAHTWVPLSGMKLAALLTSLLFVCSLGACTTPEQRAAQASEDVAQMMAVYGPACIRLGYAASSDPWRACVLNLSTKHDLQRVGSSPGYYGWGPGWRPNGWWGPGW